MREKVLGTIVTAAAFSSFVIYAYWYFNLKVYFLFVSVFFLVGMGGYMYLRLSQHKKLRNLSLAIILVALIGIGCLYHYSINLNRISILLLNLILIGLYYSFFRKIFFLKSFVISVSWILWVFFFVFKWDIVLYLQQFLYVFTLTIPFDIKSMHRDTIMTIPKKIGLSKTKYLIRILSVCYLITGALMGKIFLFNAVIQFCLINLFLNIKKSFQGIYVYIFYDGIIILQALIFFLLKYLIT
ncbi:MAG: hypothetical protein N2203_00565 [Bacteroidia bacterium]|nr:hypothetical protein [Bacteroidia bacterium]